MYIGKVVLLSFIFFRMVIFFLHYTYVCVIWTFSLSGPVPASFGPDQRGSSIFMDSTDSDLSDIEDESYSPDKDEDVVMPISI